MSDLSPDAIRALIRGHVDPKDPSSWDNAWKANATPWDVGHIQPALSAVVEGGEVHFPTKGRALVPGCGQGRDVIYIARTLGLDTLGIDAATIAVEKANENVRSEGLTNVKFDSTDFFTYTTEDKFDLVYDYTFFVAIPPHLRVSWGDQMRALIKPGGYLITLMYPVETSPPPAVLEGPPYHVRFEDYAEVLKEGEAFVRVIDRIPESSNAHDAGRHKGRDRLVVWRRV